MSAALCRTNSSGQRTSPPFTTPRSSSTIAFVSDAPLINPRACSSATSCVNASVRAGASSVAKLSGVTSYAPACRPISGWGHSMETVSRNVFAGATTYAASLSVTVNGAVTVSTAGSPPTGVGSASASASKYGCTLPSRIGGSGPLSSIVRSSIMCTATAASTCSTVWIVASPWPMAVRRSTASTSVRRAGTSGLPARSVRRNTIPCPAGAGRKVASVVAPVCSPVPRSEVARVTERLALSVGSWRPGFGVHELLELVDDLREPVHRCLRTQELAVRPRRIAEQRGVAGNIAEMPGLDEQPRAASDRELIRDARLTGDDHVILHPHAAGDPRLGHDQASRANPHVVRDVDQVIDLRPRSDHRIVHAAAIDAGVGPDLDVIPDEAATHVRNLPVLLAVLAGDIAEAVAPQHRAPVHDHAFAERRPGIERDARIQLRVVADRHAVAQHAARADATVAAELHFPPEDGMRPDRDRFLPGRPVADDRCRMDAGFPDGLWIQHGKHDQQRRIRIGDDDARLGTAIRRFQRRRDQHDRRAGALKVGCVPGRGKKRQIAGTRALERRDPGDGDGAWPHQTPPGECRDFTRGERPRSRRIHRGTDAPPATAPATGAAAPAL